MARCKSCGTELIPCDGIGWVHPTVPPTVCLEEDGIKIDLDIRAKFNNDYPYEDTKYISNKLVWYEKEVSKYRDKLEATVKDLFNERNERDALVNKKVNEIKKDYDKQVNNLKKSMMAYRESSEHYRQAYEKTIEGRLRKALWKLKK